MLAWLLLGIREGRMSIIVQNNQTLAATRDLLLPKLMSGDLRLTGAEGVV